MPLSRIQAIKKFFGETMPIENIELINLKKSDPDGFRWLGDEAVKALGETILEQG